MGQMSDIFFHSGGKKSILDPMRRLTALQAKLKFLFQIMDELQLLSISLSLYVECCQTIFIIFTVGCIFT